MKTKTKVVGDKSCFEKAESRGDLTFTLVGQDVTSPEVICEWIKLNVQNPDIDDSRLREAFDKAMQMRHLKGRRWAD